MQSFTFIYFKQLFIFNLRKEGSQFYQVSIATHI